MLMSHLFEPTVLETLYAGDSILLIFPDGTGPGKIVFCDCLVISSMVLKLIARAALLSCLIGGIPLNRVHELNYEPGEVRCNVDYNSINLLSSKQPSEAYTEVIERGQKQLIYLRENPDMKMNIKDLKYEAEEKLEAQKKSKVDAKEKNDLKQQMNNEKRLKVANEFNNSIDTKVGLGAAALTIGGIGITASTETPSEANFTQIIQNNTDPSIFENGVALNDVSEEDVENFMSASSMAQQSDQIKLEVVSETKNEGIPEPVTPMESMQSDYDYDDSWLGTITDILNDDNEFINEDEVS